MTLMRPSAGPHASTLRDRRFGYDATGNLLSIDLSGDTQDASLGAFKYTYDPVGQLLSAVKPGLTETFTFDPAGNLLDPGSASSNASQAVPSARQGSLPKLPAITGNLLNTILGHSYRYDAQGNVIAKHSAAGASGNGSPATDLTLEYDADNRLRRSVRTSGLLRHTAEYFYDAFSRRVAKRVVEEHHRAVPQTKLAQHELVSDNITLFVWEGDVLVQEFRATDTIAYCYEPNSFVPIARVISQGGHDSVRQAKENTLRRHNSKVVAMSICPAPTQKHVIDRFNLPSISWWMLRGRSNVAAQQLPGEDCGFLEAAHQAAWSKSFSDAQDAGQKDRVEYYNCDHLGIPRELLEDDGNIVWTSQIKAWGGAYRNMQDNAAANEQHQPLGFLGQYSDVETGLFYNRYRYYDADTAKYLSQDPIGLLGGLNPYIYAPNPTGWTDPLG